MTLIDWSDPEAMFGLLVDFVADERVACQGNPARKRFLLDLLAQLRSMHAQSEQVSGVVLLQELRAARDAVDPDYVDDPVMIHLRDCIEELERLQSEPP